MTYSRGEHRPDAKLTEADVRVIREMWAAGMKQREIAEHFPVSYVTIHLVVSGKNWKHVV